MKECPECSSDKIIRDVKLVDYGDSNARYNQNALVYEKPDALIFKTAVKTELRAEACGECGFIQSYLVDPKRLWFAYTSRSGNVE
ncbi:MAG: hypothetical protein KF831_14595 [Acidobacteria bacterium]|nr:hypothetical protein [Acidobacteriota bacterium]